MAASKLALGAPSMTRSSAAILFATPVLAPVAVLDTMTLPHGTRVTASGDLPTGWACVLLNLWPDVLKDENRSLIATLAKPRPNQHATRSDGELLRTLRRRVQGWLNGADAPRDAVGSTAELRARLYADAATFATGSPGGWSPTVVACQKPAGKTVKPQQPARRQHKPHGPRRDLYWTLTTDKGHRVLYKAASAVGRAMSSGTAPVPPGWHLCRGIEYGDGAHGTAAKKTLRVRADYDSDPSVPFTQRLAIETFVTWIKAVASSAGRR